MYVMILGFFAVDSDCLYFVVGFDMLVLAFCCLDWWSALLAWWFCWCLVAVG